MFGEQSKMVDASNGTLLGDVVASVDLLIEQPCAGRGTCGRCKVLVEKGANQPDEIERENLTSSELSVGTRLACRATVNGDTQIILSPIEVHSNKVFKASSRYKRERDIPLGLGIDLGSTTVAAYLTMLDNGEVVAGGAALNQQRIYGADVISRLSAAQQNEEHRDRLQRLALASIYQAIDSLKLSKALLARIRKISIVGNVAMHHLLIGLPIDTIAVMPFQPSSTAVIPNQRGLLSGVFSEDVQIIIPPLIGGFVGSDALACLAYFEFDKVSGPTLAVDLGTNGEVLLTDGNRIVTASTAAGPAFEGVDISCGMRAVDGAIVDAKFIDGQFEFQTIGDAPPLGLTGSGLMKVVNELLQFDVIEPNGRISKENGFFDIDRSRGDKRIYLTRDRQIWLTQKDIREFQKAKGAIRAAIDILLRELAISPKDLTRVILTGSFGGQLDIDSVLDLGMLPRVSPKIIENIPSGAGYGATKFLSDEGFQQGIRLAEIAEQVNLDQAATFREVFIESLSFFAPEVTNEKS
ncbi:MAG TPA: ASKHA domain-containing protein [Anaerolineales bacterium]|nr:ASKHA domain-containing protein [Anaerolineales bacterium]